MNPESGPFGQLLDRILCAFFITPGISAKVNSLLLTITFARFGVIVVNGYSPIFGFAALIFLINDDLPAFGKPTIPTSAINLSFKYIHFKSKRIILLKM